MSWRNAERSYVPTRRALTSVVEPTHSYDLNDYLAMARRHWWIVVLALIIGGAAGVEYNRRLPREYVSMASVIVYPAGQDANVAGGRTRGEINLDTEAQLVRSTSVVMRAAQLLNLKEDDLAAGVSVEVPANTSVLQIKFTAPTPSDAQAGARAFAESYLRNREENAKATIAAQTEALQEKVSDLTDELAEISRQQTDISRTSGTFANLESRRETVLGQISQLTNKINQLATETVSGGVIIRDARRPGRPIKPHTPINVAAGALLGLLAGIGLSSIRERLDRRVRTAAEVGARCGIPVLGEITDRVVPTDDVYPPFGDGGRAFNRLRNEVVAALEPGEQVVVVAGASRGPAATHVAANLAAALARTGTNVVLVGAHPPDCLARLLGVAPTPGVSDVLAGKAGLGEATQRAARNPTLRVITVGGTGSAAGLWQSQALRDMLYMLRANVDYVVIEAPSTSAGADAQSLASLADAAIIAIELRRTRRPDIVDAAEQLRRVGTGLLGAVVMPRVPSPVPLKEPLEEQPAVDEPKPAINGHTHEPGFDETVLMSKLDDVEAPQR